jgi:oligoribonuclease NrnB/cAMP/cGMP phosphodiesterase (DHH superfamily)
MHLRRLTPRAIKRRNNMRKIKLFTHNDLDGIGCAILANLAFIDLDIEYCDYGNINEKVKALLENKDYNNYQHIYITDISVSEDIAAIINNTQCPEFKEDSKFYNHFTLIDHHPTAKHLEKYCWCTIQIENEKGKCSGTSLFYDYLLTHVEHSEIMNSNAIKDFVETVRQYDSWEWKTIFNNEAPKEWNNLLRLYGRERFVKKIIENLKEKSEFAFDKTDLLLLELNEDKKQLYFEKKSKELIKQDVQSYKVGVVFSEQYISELGNYLAEKFLDLDFIILIGSKTISYRGIKDIDLGLFAKQFGGGGHPKASGSEIDANKQIEYIKSLFS